MKEQFRLAFGQLVIFVWLLLPLVVLTGLSNYYQPASIPIDGLVLGAMAAFWYLIGAFLLLSCFI